LGVPPKEILPRKKSRTASLLPEEVRASTELFSRVLAGTGLYDTLESIYPRHADKLLRFNGKRFAVAAFPAPPEQWDDVESVRGDLLTTSGLSEDEYPKGLFDEYGYDEFMKLLEKEKSFPLKYWNDPTYDFADFKVTKEGLKLSFKVGSYFHALSTTDALIERELLKNLSKNPNARLKLGQLPRRKWLHDQLAKKDKDPILCGDFRSAATGVNTLIVFKDKDTNGWYFFGHPRSDNVATYPCFFHIIPSGMFQPVVLKKEPQRAFEIKRSFFREYLEELYNHKDAKRPSNRAHVGYLDYEPPLRRLRRRIESRDPNYKAELCFTGVSMNLLTLRPDICLLLLIRDPDWYDQEGTGKPDKLDKNRIFSIDFNDEYLPERDAPRFNDILKNLGLRKLATRVALNEKLEIADPDILGPHNMLPPAAAFIHFGLKVARRKLGIE